MATAALIPAILGLAGNVAGGLISSEDKGPRSRDIIDADFFGSTGPSLIQNLAEMQAAFGQGATPRQLTENFIFRQAEQLGTTPKAITIFQDVEAAENLADAGDIRGAEARLARANASLRGFGSRSAASGASFSLGGDGQVIFRTNDPDFDAQLAIAEQVSAGGDPGGILGDRLRAIREATSLIADIPGSFGDFVQAGLDQANFFAQDAISGLSQQANVGGFNPAAGISRILEGVGPNALDTAIRLISGTTNAALGTQDFLNSSASGGLSIPQAGQIGSSNVSNAQAAAAARQRSDENLGSGVAAGLNEFAAALIANRQPGTDVNKIPPPAAGGTTFLDQNGIARNIRDLVG